MMMMMENEREKEENLPALEQEHGLHYNTHILYVCISLVYMHYGHTFSSFIFLIFIREKRDEKNISVTFRDPFFFAFKDFYFF